MFWGYTPALDLLREYFWWRGKRRDRDAAEAAEAAVERRVGVADVKDHDGAADRKQLAEGAGHVQQEDDPADDCRGRVVGELLFPVGRDAARRTRQQGALLGQAGGGRDAGEQRHGAGGQPGPVPLADGAHRRGHGYHDGAVDVQPDDGCAQCQRHHPVRADQQGLLPPPLPAQEHPRDADRGPEVRARRGDPGATTGVMGSAAAGDPLGGLFATAAPQEDQHSDGDTLDVLLVGGMDCRHVLKTLSRLHCHADSLAESSPTAAGDADAAGEGGGRRRRVRFYVAETVMELVARQLLFILAALEPPDRLGRTEKVRLLLELLGNSLVRPSTALWVRNASRLLVDLVTDEAALRRRLPLVDLSHLRHRDRDRLEEVLAFYQERPQNFRIGFHWDQRLRRHLGLRYDTRAGAVDWDYHMALKDLPAGDRVCVHEYRQWRETGVAFTWLEAEQSEPNLTLAAGIVREGSRLLHGGYLGDIVTSPFIAYSIELEPEDASEVFRKANDRYVSRSTDAAERHLTRIAYELQHRQHYRPKEDSSSADGGLILSRVTDHGRLDPVAPPDEDDPTLRKVHHAADMLNYEPLPVPDAEVVFLSPRFLQAPLEGRTRFARRFDVAVLGLGLGERHLDPALSAVLAPEAVVLVEGSRFLLQRREDRLQAAQDLERRARDAGLAPLQPFDPDKDDYAKFVVDAG